jgi:transglutaminase-like putative cysteine protease
MEADLSTYLVPARFIDSDHEAVRAFADRLTEGATSPRERARRLFAGVRDEIVYDPYVDFDAPGSYRASACLAAGRGYCVAKAVLYAASLRSAGIPARIGFADVRNHLATPRLLALMGSDVFILHGYTSVHLEGRWIKATPTFNLSLCERFGVKPLEFDGESDTLFHAYDRAGRRHMEYLRDHGTFADVPIDWIIPEMRRAYPRLFESSSGSAKRGDFAAEASSASAISDAS